MFLCLATCPVTSDNCHHGNLNVLKYLHDIMNRFDVNLMILYIPCAPIYLSFLHLFCNTFVQQINWQHCSILSKLLHFTLLKRKCNVKSIFISSFVCTCICTCSCWCMQIYVHMYAQEGQSSTSDITRLHVTTLMPSNMQTYTSCIHIIHIHKIIKIQKGATTWGNHWETLNYWGRNAWWLLFSIFYLLGISFRRFFWGSKV